MSKPWLAGTANGRAKLTEAKVLEIRAASGTQQEIADKYGLSRAQIGSIRRNEAWTHIHKGVVPESVSFSP